MHANFSSPDVDAAKSRAGRPLRAREVSRGSHADGRRCPGSAPTRSKFKNVRDFSYASPEFLGFASCPAPEGCRAGREVRRGMAAFSLTKLVHRPDEPAGVSPARTRRVSHRATAGGRAAEAEQRQGRAYALCFVSQSTKRKSDPAGCHPAGCPSCPAPEGCRAGREVRRGMAAFSLTKLVHRPDEPAGVSPARGRSPRHGRWKSSRGRVELTLCALSHKAQSVSLTLLAGRTPRFRLPPRFGAFGSAGSGDARSDDGDAPDETASSHD